MIRVSPQNAVSEVPAEQPSASSAPESLELATLPEAIRDVFEAFADSNHSVWLTGQVLRDLIVAGEIKRARRLEFITDANASTCRQLIEAQGHLELQPASKGGAANSNGRSGGRGAKPSGVRARGRGAVADIQIQPLRRQAPPYRWFRGQNFEGIELDLATREITLHALALADDGTIIDPFGGVDDLFNQTINTIIPPQRAFRESGVWVLKVAKYVGYYGFEPTRDVVRAARRDAGSVLDSQTSQWCGHLTKVLMSNHVMAALDFLYDSGALQFLLPEVEAMIGFHKSCRFHHKDLWDHTKLVIHRAARNPVVRWAALMHDIGKVATRSTTKDGKVHFFRHEDFGALLFLGVAARIQMDPDFTERVEYVIRQHSRVNLYDENWTDSAVRRLIRDCGDRLDDLVAFSKADFTTKRQERQQAIIRQLDELERRIAEISEIDSRVPPLPKGLGTQIIDAFGLPPSKRIGELRDWLEAQVEAGHVDGHQAAEVYIDHLRAHAAELDIQTS